MIKSANRRPDFLRPWLLWSAGVLAFPITGLVLGTAQTFALPRRTRLRWLWAVAVPALWALGWTVTTLGGIKVDEQFTIFGAYGAVTFSVLSGLVLHVILAPRPVVDAGSSEPPIAVTP